MGFAGTGIGVFEADSKIPYVQVNAYGDIVPRGGFSAHGETEIMIDVGANPILSLGAHDISRTIDTLGDKPYYGEMGFEEANTLGGERYYYDAHIGWHRLEVIDNKQEYSETQVEVSAEEREALDGLHARLFNAGNDVPESWLEGLGIESREDYISIEAGQVIYTRPDGREYVVDSDTNEVVYLDEEGDIDESGEASYVGEEGDSGLFSGVDGGEVESAARNLSQLLQAIEGNDTLGSVLNALDLYQDFVDLSEEGRDHDVDGLDTAVSLSSFFYYSIKKRSKKSETCLPALRVPCAFQKSRVFGNSPNLRFASDSPNPDPTFSAMLGGIQGELVAYRWVA